MCNNMNKHNIYEPPKSKLEVTEKDSSSLKDKKAPPRIKIFLKYYGNGIATILGAIGYLSIPGSYFFKPLAIFVPFIIFFFWAFSIGLIYTILQGIYGVSKYYSTKKKSKYLNHCKGSLLSLLGYAIFLIGVSFGLVVTA